MGLSRPDCLLRPLVVTRSCVTVRQTVIPGNCKSSIIFMDRKKGHATRRKKCVPKFVYATWGVRHEEKVKKTWRIVVWISLCVGGVYWSLLTGSVVPLSKWVTHPLLSIRFSSSFPFPESGKLGHPFAHFDWRQGNHKADTSFFILAS